MRTIEIRLNDEFQAVVDETPRILLDGAVGYLATWAMHSERYAKVSIYGERDGNLDATYMDANGNVTYTLYGLRNDDDGTYSFHS